MVFVGYKVALTKAVLRPVEPFLTAMKLKHFLVRPDHWLTVKLSPLSLGTEKSVMEPARLVWGVRTQMPQTQSGVNRQPRQEPLFPQVAKFGLATVPAVRALLL